MYSTVVKEFCLSLEKSNRKLLTLVFQYTIRVRTSECLILRYCLILILFEWLISQMVMFAIITIPTRIIR